MNLLEKFIAYIKSESLFQQNDHILIAVSGGADSTVLCELMHKANFTFTIAHCNFKLRVVESDRDELFVKNLSEKYKVAFFVKHFETQKIAADTKKSIEETARDLRYTWFKELIIEHNLKNIATAHHADDNIETVLMNFFRGTGIKGLRGILPKQTNIIRPILFAKRNEIESYAAENSLEFVTDSSNATNDYTRNYFRNELIPAIVKVYPEAKQNILHNIDRFRDIALLYEEKIKEVKSKIIEKRGEEIHIPVLKLAKTKSLQTIIYEIISAYNFTTQQIGEVEKLLISESGKFILSPTHRMLKNRNWLIISPLQVNDISSLHVIESANSEINFSAGKLKITSIEKPESLLTDTNTCYINTKELEYPLILRRWKTGDYFYPLGMQKKKKLSRFFIDQKLSLMQKENVWVLETNKKIVWVVGLRMDDRFKVSDTSGQYIVKLSLNH